MGGKPTEIVPGIEMFPSYPEWKKIAWRWIRTSIAAAITQALLVQPDWTNPKQTITALAVAGVSGFLVALGMAIRDWFAGENKQHPINKLPV